MPRLYDPPGDAADFAADADALADHAGRLAIDDPDPVALAAHLARTRRRPGAAVVLPLPPGDRPTLTVVG